MELQDLFEDERIVFEDMDDDNQLHIIVIAILCIMIAAIIIYFHFTKKFGCFFEVNSKSGWWFGYTHTEDTNHKTTSSEPNAPVKNLI